jgi:hypothetical protein
MLLADAEAHAIIYGQVRVNTCSCTSEPTFCAVHAFIRMAMNECITTTDPDVTAAA